LWFVAGAVLLLGVGFFQLYPRGDQCRKRSPVSIALLWVAAAVLLLTILFPQAIASFIAG
jgi:hypothetical protein